MHSLKVLPLMTGVGHYIATHATLTARFMHLHFFHNLSQVFPVLAVANTGSRAGPQNKIGHPAGGRFHVECPWNINRLQNMCYCFSGIAF